MSFRCDMCKGKAEGKPNKIVTKTMEYEHPAREGVFVKRDLMTGEKVKYDDPGGSGTQIVKEVKACDECKKAWFKKINAEKLRTKQVFEQRARPNTPFKV